MQRGSVIDAARGKWRGILIALGIDEKFLTGKNCPCPNCGGKDRFRFRDTEGTGSYHCSGCGSGYGISLVIKYLNIDNFRDACLKVESVIGGVKITSSNQNEPTEAERVAYCSRILSSSRAVTTGDPVWRYLNRRLGISDIPPDIRFHPSIKHVEDGRMHPVMLSIIRDEHGREASLHRTYLTEDGQKLSTEKAKKILKGKSMIGGSVRLCNFGIKIAVGEGIESSLAGQQIFGIPVCAATSAQMMEKWIPPKFVKHVTILADNDRSFTGQASAYALAKRLTLMNKLDVRVVIPEEPDTDWCDVLEKRRAT